DSGRERFRLEGHFHALTFSPDGRVLAGADRAGAIHLWEMASGQERRQITGEQGPLRALSFSPDGKALASGGEDTTILIWDIRHRDWAGRPAAELERQWAALAGPAREAFAAVQMLAAAPEMSVPWLRGRLRAASLDRRRLARQIADLDSEE